MDARTFARPQAAPIGSVYRYVGAATLLAMLALITLLVAVRRVSGALNQPLDVVSLLLAAATLAATAAMIRAVYRQSPPPGWTPSHWLVLLVPSVALLIFGLVVCLPGTPTAGLVSFWAIVIGEELWSWRRRLTHTPRVGRKSPTRPTALPELPAAPATTAALTLDEEPADASVWQRITRRATADGTQLLHGWLRADFDAGQRTTSAHLAFCPPFARAVKLEHRQLDGPASRVKVAELLPYGARLDIKLTRPADQSVSVVIECTVAEISIS